MREIKFRAWDKKEKKIVKVETLWYHNGELLDLTVDTRGCIRADNFILLQFTGLKDKNGKEIYEGDIVEFDNLFDEEDKRSKSVVEWNNGYLINEIAGMGSIEYFEVIGNIYENKNLLEVK